VGAEKFYKEKGLIKKRFQRALLAHLRGAIVIAK
jgi:hypothetical protein